MQEITPQSSEVEIIAEGDAGPRWPVVHEVSRAASDVTENSLSWSGRTPRQSSIRSGPGGHVTGDDDLINTSVCRKRKGHSPSELGRSSSVDDLSVHSGRKSFKTPAAPPGHHNRMAAAVRQCPSGLLVCASALPVRVRDRSPRT